MNSDLSRLVTEQINERSKQLDQMDSLQIVQLMNEEDHQVPKAIQSILPEVAKTVDQIADTIRKGGRIFYIGAGTSGRLGVLDASECPPTFRTEPELFQGIVAGGDVALRSAVEGAEDSEEAGVRDLQERSFSAGDFLVGLAASGRTPYVCGAVQYANQIGAKTAAITCNPGSVLGQMAQFKLEVNVGPEVLVGSTRLKSGTAQKMILNMLSTASMVRLGKTYQNLMVDLKPSNFKLKDRALRIIRTTTGVNEQEADRALLACGDEVKTAMVMILADVTPEEARHRLERAKGRVADALQL
ncbi:N-acetylmuramic acid 6-phosphate etherase [Paenactinomyces guangxiensis]|uniref:N-acetylmuramic acid 6-phosphate etherase n=1 Tax=Paenactinomyces guangxiensis TaxID=1490290 RepID=A0A7W2A8Q3_9BACL|nr:N-acetylmuramic acid 6-phosphate etherase [Paenactinomyces guangxiensis]MBA4494073.1 N-acetylmuramic acid 6-phosphate etherase [Paenactinomyces guangxiensis]MBH8591182.1 N-acetylmuramic acid 6-phosphate etherase [Paenactinomyces guangxiensis]